MTIGQAVQVVQYRTPDWRFGCVSFWKDGKVEEVVGNDPRYQVYYVRLVDGSQAVVKANGSDWRTV